MGLQPNITKKRTSLLKTCAKCGRTLSSVEFAPTKSPFFPDGTLSICGDCIDEMIAASDSNWAEVDKLCQMVNIPFIPKKWEELRELSEAGAFGRYAAVFQKEEYEGLGWGDYYEAFKKLKSAALLETELPELAEQREKDLKAKWGANYDDEALQYLEDLYNGLLTTQNVNGALQIDQAKKICKMSYEVDRRIAEGDDFDKLLASYDKLVKAAEFSPKNVKNINDFDSVGELIKWLEKTGWENGYYDNVPKDVVDETIANIQSFNRRLYTNESGIGDEITARINSLKQAERLENSDYYMSGVDTEQDLDKYEVAALNDLWATEEEEDFKPDGGSLDE